MSQLLPDNEGRRSGIERRNFSYNFHIPERRSDNERRNGKDRRLRTKNIKIIKTKDIFLNERRFQD